MKVCKATGSVKELSLTVGAKFTFPILRKTRPCWIEMMTASDRTQ